MAALWPGCVILKVIFESGKWRLLLANNLFKVGFVLTILIQEHAYLGMNTH